MKCRCGGDTFVNDTRMGALDTIRRRRVCVDCAGRFTTYESRIAPWVVMKHRTVQAARKKRAWHLKSKDERKALKKRERIRAEARAEAAVTGRFIEDVYREWDCA